MDFEDVIKNRFACREFLEKEVEQDKIEKILSAANMAPTAKNIQPFKIYVIKSKEGIDKIDKASPCRYGAPLVFLICGDKDTCFVKGGHACYEMDSTIVLTHMMLEATNIGLANIWVEMFDENILREELAIPDNLIPVALLPTGYSNLSTSVNHNKRKNIDEIIEYI